MPSTLPQTLCAVCDSSNSRRCGPCAAAGFDLFFCSPEHQKLVWKTHKQVCGAESNPFMPPDLSAAEDEKLRSVKPAAKVFPSLHTSDDWKTAKVLWEMQYGERGTPMKLEAVDLGPRVLFGGLGAPGTLQCQPRLKQAFLLQAHAELYQLTPAPGRLRSIDLTPFHHASALYTGIRLLHPGFIDPDANNHLLHALLILFTLASLESRPDGPPTEYDGVNLLNAVRNVLAILSLSGICVGEMGDTFKLLQESLAGVAKIEFDLSSRGGAKQVGMKRFAVV
ncbi:hypothetical protein JCM10450v2_005298 [Rhodotorula kratochvilovae]